MSETPDYISVEEARKHPAMSGVSANDTQVGRVLAAVEERIERATDRAFVPRQTVEYHLLADSAGVVWLDHTPATALDKVVVDGDDQDLADYRLARAGRLTGNFPAVAEIEVTYTYGLEAPPVGLVDAAVRAAATLLRHAANPRIGEKSQSLNAEAGGTIVFAEIADISRGRPFGMPDIDTVVMSYARHVPTVG